MHRGTAVQQLIIDRFAQQIQQNNHFKSNLGINGSNEKSWPATRLAEQLRGRIIND